MVSFRPEPHTSRTPSPAAVPSWSRRRVSVAPHGVSSCGFRESSRPPFPPRTPCAAIPAPGYIYGRIPPSTHRASPAAHCVIVRAATMELCGFPSPCSPHCPAQFCPPPPSHCVLWFQNTVFPYIVARRPLRNRARSHDVAVCFSLCRGTTLSSPVT